MVEHHLPDELLLEYAAGTADPGHALIAACHLTLCPRCRDAVAELEAIGGALIDLAAPAEVSPFEHASITELGARDHDHDEQPALAADDTVFPWPLQRLIGPYSSLAWRRRLPGLRTFDFSLPGAGTRIRMVEAKANMTVVTHGHRGLEVDLVLAGGLHDRTRERTFERGDIQCSTAELTHELAVLPGEPCVLLTINEGPFVPDGLWSRLIYGYLGWTR